MQRSQKTVSLIYLACGFLVWLLFREIAATGVDYASAGALTHSAPNFDVALDIDA